MKKTKLLIPALSIVGLATAVAPMATMTSCSNKPSSGDTWEKCSYEELDAKMGPLYEAYNKQNNYNSFAPSDLVVKYNGEETTNYTIKNHFMFADSDAKAFESKNLVLRPIGVDLDMKLFYPKNEIVSGIETYPIHTISKKNNDFKIYFQGYEGQYQFDYTFIVNGKGYVTYYSYKANDQQGKEIESHLFEIEYIKDLHEVKDYTFVSKQNNEYEIIEPLMKNDTEYKFNVKKSTSELSKFKIIYYDSDAIPHVVDLQNSVTITAGGETVTTTWVTDHLEFAIAADKDISITLNKNDLPENYGSFKVSIYNE